MERAPSTPRRGTRGRPRGRATTSLRVARQKTVVAPGASEPPPKRRRYVPGGPGGGGRFIEEDGTEVPPESTPTTVSRPRGRTSNVAVPPFIRRERSTRIRTAGHQDEAADEEQFGSAAAVAAAVVQSEGYKPREERGWEEFHPNLDIEATFMVYLAEDVDGTAAAAKSATPATPSAQQQPDTPANGTSTPPKTNTNADTGGTVAAPPSLALDTPAPPAKPSPLDAPSFSTPRRRVGRPPRDPFSFYSSQTPNASGAVPRTPKILPIHNQTPKERLDLKLPSYRKTDRIQLFESKTFGQARYVDKSMMNVGYQESDHFIRPERNLLKASDANADDDAEQSGAPDGGSHTAASSGAVVSGGVGRVEYDMDEQDDMWLESLNAQRRAADLLPITREMLEITITKIEKEWHALEKRIPKPNPKPPQTHRPRSSSAVAVNGEPQGGEEQDSKCAICDDGDCENTNAIVFCDGCDLAVHQECYGVPFIPEGQWLCRKCQLIGRGIPTCIFCPNTDGAFKQTNSSKWAHLLCAMWIPEVSLGNHTFMEPVMEVEKVPKNRWKLTCYICNQRMGACIQCSNKNCYQAFHVTCARRGRLFLKMKNSQGALSVLDGNVLLKAFCDRHCPADYAKENAVTQATRQAKRFYKRTMKGRMWVDSHASAAQLAATHRHAITEHPPDESQMTGAKVSAVLADKKKAGQPAKPIWKLPSGAPVIPQAVYDAVEAALQRFPIAKRRDFVADACRYWTLKREARRGAALLKRLQLQMETFSSMELTRRNFSAMGPSGRARLARRVDFAAGLVADLEQLKALSDAVVEREALRLEAAEAVQDFVDLSYFPIYKMLIPVVDKAFAFDKNVFKEGLEELQNKLDKRFYTTTLAFAHDLCEVIHVGVNGPAQLAPTSDEPRPAETVDVPAPPNPTTTTSAEIRDRKRLGKRILKAVHPLLEAALRAEADVGARPLDVLLKELEGMLEASLEVRQATITVSNNGVAAAPVAAAAADDEHDPDVAMTDADEGQIVVAGQARRTRKNLAVSGVEDGGDGVVGAPSAPDADADAMDVDERGIKAGTPEPVATADAETLDDSNAVAVWASASATGDKLAKPKQEVAAVGAGKAGGDAGSPPSLNGYEPGTGLGTATATATQQSELDPQPQLPPSQQVGPLTPPQSNRSLGNVAAAANVLSDGGVPWYLEEFEIRGTSAVQERRRRWGPGGRDAARRSLSEEELTDIDDEVLKDLEFDVDDDTINATPAGAGAPGGGDVRERGRSGAGRSAAATRAATAALRKKADSARVVKRALRSSAKRK